MKREASISSKADEFETLLWSEVSARVRHMKAIISDLRLLAK